MLTKHVLLFLGGGVGSSFDMKYSYNFWNIWFVVCMVWYLFEVSMLVTLGLHSSQLVYNFQFCFALFLGLPFKTYFMDLHSSSLGFSCVHLCSFTLLIRGAAVWLTSVNDEIIQCEHNMIASYSFVCQY